LANFLSSYRVFPHQVSVLIAAQLKYTDRRSALRNAVLRIEQPLSRAAAALQQRPE
jgi:hypothetical protein